MDAHELEYQAAVRYMADLHGRPARQFRVGEELWFRTASMRAGRKGIVVSLTETGAKVVDLDNTFTVITAEDVLPF